MEEPMISLNLTSTPDMSNFNDSQRNQINVAIIGSISVGKSTLLNTILF